MKTILIVDDEKNLLLSLSEGLRFYDSNFKVITAENGQQAIDILNSARIDLLVTDLKMPVADGFDLLADALKKHPRLPVIVMTAFSNPDIERKLKAFGITEYFEKPVEFMHIAETISSVLNSAQAKKKKYGNKLQLISKAFHYLNLKNRKMHQEGGHHARGNNSSAEQC
ncbi:MAG: response regulator [Nitrospiraceae bacterium]|nr:response regulator [Nitrospiraceae bacterium]